MSDTLERLRQDYDAGFLEYRVSRDTYRALLDIAEAAQEYRKLEKSAGYPGGSTMFGRGDARRKLDDTLAALDSTGGAER